MNSEQKYELQMTFNRLQEVEHELDNITLALLVNAHLNLVNEEGAKSGEEWYSLSGDMIALHTRQEELRKEQEALEAQL